MQTIYQTLNFIVKDSVNYVNGFHEYNGDISNLPQRLNRSLKVIKPTALFILNDKPIILFFDKSVDKQEVEASFTYQDGQSTKVKTSIKFFTVKGA